MAITFPKPAAVYGDRLEQEIAAAGYRAEVAVAGDRVEVTGHRRGGADDGREIDESDKPTIGPIVAAHTGQPTEEQQRPVKARQKIEATIAQFEADHANWGALTAAQKDAANRRAQLAIGKLGRFLVGKFDVPE